ncbi:MAG: tetratricopeptide repeat protein [Candidatus Obscuribacterales bacterium]|nr:tetratricopeptide repeat protein [Candidatus Obscuribacterales bacterium]
MPNDILRREAERLRHLSETCAQQCDYATARQLLKMVIEIEESDILVSKEILAADLHQLGRICFFMGGRQEARHYLQTAIDLRLNSVPQDAKLIQEMTDLLEQVKAEMDVVKTNLDIRTSH